MQSQMRTAQHSQRARRWLGLAALVVLGGAAQAQTQLYDRILHDDSIAVVGSGGQLAVRVEVEAYNVTNAPLDLSVEVDVYVNNVAADNFVLSIGGAGSGGFGGRGGGGGGGGGGPYPSACGATCGINECYPELLSFATYCHSLPIPNVVGFSCICMSKYVNGPNWGSGSYPVQVGDVIRVEIRAAAGAVAELDTSNDVREITVGGGAPPVFNYCTSGVTSNGCVPSISSSAQPSASASTSPLLIAAAVEGQKQGLMFYGVSNSGFTPMPWASGSSSFLCVKSPTQRMGVQSSGGTASACDGMLLRHWNAFAGAHPAALGQPFAAGDKLYVQAWFRDPAAPKTTNLSNAVELTFIP